jgi:hypothetical protein
MRGLARLAMRGPLAAGGCAASCILGAQVIWLLLVPASALVALTVLRHGALAGVKVAAIATSLAVVVRQVVLGDWLGMATLAASVWLPAIVLGLLLRRSARQSWPLLGAAVLALAYAVVMRAAVDDVTAFWADTLSPLFDLLARDGVMQLDDAQRLAFATQVHLWSVVGLQCLHSTAVLLARWWQACLFNPGGFGQEFCALDLPRGMSLIAGGVAGAFVVGQLNGAHAGIVGDACVILMVLFGFQGLAVIHFRARAVALGGGWLAVLYVTLALLPHVAGMLLAATGLFDNVADVRRLRARSSA